MEQSYSGHSGHFIIDSRPLRAPPPGTKKNKIPKLVRHVIHTFVILCPRLWFNKPVCGRWDVTLSLVFSLDNPLVKAWGSSLSSAVYKVRKNFLSEQTYKPSSVPRPGRGGDHPSSPDVTIGVKRPTRGSRPSTLNLSQSPETSGGCALLFGLAPDGVCPVNWSPSCW